jgi:hypothetical protein
VCQDLPAAVAALVKTAGSGGSSAHGSAAAGIDGAGVVQLWQQRVAAADAAGELPGLQDLLPQHDRLAAAVSRSSAVGGDGGSWQQQQQQQGCNRLAATDGQLSDDTVLLLRAQQLLAFAGSQGYAAALAQAQPLRHVLRPTLSVRAAVDRCSSSA